MVRNVSERRDSARWRFALLTVVLALGMVVTSPGIADAGVIGTGTQNYRGCTWGGYSNYYITGNGNYRVQAHTGVPNYDLGCGVDAARVRITVQYNTCAGCAYRWTTITSTNYGGSSVYYTTPSTWDINQFSTQHSIRVNGSWSYVAYTSWP